MQTTTKRDPKKDPRPGDELVKNGKDREVFDRYEEDGREYITYSGTWCCTPTVLLTSFKRWAKNAEVLYVAKQRN